MPITEKDVEKHLVLKVKSMGGWAIKMTSSNNWGLPDRIVLLPGGLICFVELKSPGRKASPRQKRVIAFLKSIGFIAVVIDGINKVDAFLKYMSTLQCVVRTTPSED